jgi:hypothetical protein
MSHHFDLERHLFICSFALTKIQNHSFLHGFWYIPKILVGPCHFAVKTILQISFKDQRVIVCLRIKKFVLLC